MRLVLAIAVLAALPVCQALAAPKLYNMDSFFAEPHPFAPAPPRRPGPSSCVYRTALSS
ncbi:MAG: hypothetical protein IIC04_11760 [Proteobacteria bacterium]|nr:hypothetical protein [Pseudomonadota bacterium]